jgi:hypothetical protein
MYWLYLELVEKRITREQSRNTKEEKLRTTTHRFLRKPTAAAKTVFTNTQGSVTSIITLEIIYKQTHKP